LDNVKRIALLTLVAGLAACGVTETENFRTVTGTVVAASAGGGYAAGQAIDGAEVTLRYTPPISPGSSIRDTDITDGTGAYTVMSGPPEGQTDPDCSTLSVVTVKAGFASATVRLTALCGAGPGELSDLVIELTPN